MFFFHIIELRISNNFSISISISISIAIFTAADTYLMGNARVESKRLCTILSQTLFPYVRSN